MTNDLPHTDKDDGHNYDLDFFLEQRRSGAWYKLKHASDVVSLAYDGEVALWLRLPQAVRAMATAIGKETRK